jgi:succinate-semialdehyde dehydrogenase / glutarate-semialdehyde dehydrogenase
VTDPATGDRIGTVPALGAEETRRAIMAADAAWPAWRALPGSERGYLLEAWHDLMIEHIEELALIMTVEQGKPLAEARGEIRYGAGFIKWFAEEPAVFTATPCLRLPPIAGSSCSESRLASR